MQYLVGSPYMQYLVGSPWWLSGKESAGYMALIPGSGRSPGGGNGNPLQHPCPENPIDRGDRVLQSMGLLRLSATKPIPCNNL